MNNVVAKPRIIFVLSNNRDFIEPFSSLVTRELGVSCNEITSEAEIKEQGASLLVADRTVSGTYQFPVIIVSLPVRIKILFSDIKAALDNFTDDSIAVGDDFLLAVKHKTLTHKSSSTAVDLTDKESQLLQAIAQSGESGISRESLLKEVWGIDSVLDTHTLETHIYRLRKKIKDSFDSEIITFFQGVYKL